MKLGMVKILLALIFVVLMPQLWRIDIFPQCVCNLLQFKERFSERNNFCTANSKKAIEKHSSKKIISNVNSTIRMSTFQEKIKQITRCLDKSLRSRTEQRGQYWVLYNYVPASKEHKCGESITYTTPADYSFLDNISPVVERWRGPVSVALYAPGDDFQKTVNSIRYLRDCSSRLIKEYVTFHVFFDTEHLPQKIPKQDIFTHPFNCSLKAPYDNVKFKMMYRGKKNLTYPINVARNIARETAQTHFVLASDIELYPSLDIIERFLKMIVKNPKLIQGENPRVFVISPFEVVANQMVPTTKSILQEMLLNKAAFTFHQNICRWCHDIPKAIDWQKAKETADLNVFHVAKRDRYWEPVYIGTNNEPLYDERLSWDGKKDKVIHGYVLCVLDYDLMILDNAFLVHKPGIKVHSYDHERQTHVAKTNWLIASRILSEFRILYGEREGCIL